MRAGEIATIRVKLTNAGLPPEPVALSLAGVPAGWKVDILGGGQPVASAMPGVNQDVSLQLRVEVPKDAQPGSQKIVLSAKGPLTQSPDLLFTLTVGTEAPAKLSLKSRLPSLRGTPRSAFEYTVTVGNDSGKDLTVALSAQSPANFQTTFTEGFGSNEISSIPIEAGQTKDIKVKVTPPRDVKAGDYPGAGQGRRPKAPRPSCASPCRSPARASSRSRPRTAGFAARPRSASPPPTRWS